MRFIFLNDYPIEEIIFLRGGKYSIVSGPTDDEIIYEVNETLRGKMVVLEEAGLIKEIKVRDIMEIRNILDLIPLTEKVEILNGGSVYLKVCLPSHTFLFSESELLGTRTLALQLLRLKKVIQIKIKDWHELLTYWLSIAVDINEPSEEDIIIEKTLNYLCEGIIFKDVEKAIAPFALLYRDDEPDIVYVMIEHLIPRLEINISRRRVRSILSEYITGESTKITIYSKRFRFWRFKIEQCGINLEKQMFKEEAIEADE